MDTRLLGPASGPGVGDRPTACPPPSSEGFCSAGPPSAVGTRGSGGNKRLYKDPCSNCFVLKNDGLSPSCSDFVFSSFLSAVNTTSGFEIKGDTLADEFTARCWLLECTTVDLIQSTRNHRAPAPTPRATDTT